MVFFHTAQGAIEPAVFRGFHPRSAGLHIVLGIEVRAGVVRRTGGMHDGQMPGVPQGLECSHGRMQPKKAIKINRAICAPRTGNGNTGTHGIIRSFAMRHYDIQPVSGPALKKYDQPFRAAASRRICGVHRACEKTGNHSGAYNG